MTRIRHAVQTLLGGHADAIRRSEPQGTGAACRLFLAAALGLALAGHLAAQDTTTISDARTATNGGVTVDGDDTLTIAAGDSQGRGSITVSGAGVHAISLDSAGNTVNVNGGLSTNGDGAHAIRNESGDSQYHIRGNITVSGANSHAVHNEAGAATYTLHDGFSITGTDANGNGVLNTEVATATLDLSGLTASYALSLRGAWLDADGNYLRGGTADRTALGWYTVLQGADGSKTGINGGATLDGNDTVVIKSGGGVEVSTGGPPAFLPLNDGNRIEIEAGGSVTARGSLSSAARLAIGLANGDDNEVIIAGTINYRENALLTNGSHNNTYRISGSLSPVGAPATAILHTSGTGAAYILEPGMSIDGLLQANADDPVLDLSGLTGSYRLELQGDWHTPPAVGETATESLRHTGERGWLSVVRDARTTENGDFTIDGNDHFTLAGQGASITTPAGHSGVVLRGDNNWVFVDGSVSSSHAPTLTSFGALVAFESNDNVITLGAGGVLEVNRPADAGTLNFGILTNTTRQSIAAGPGSGNRFVINGTIQTSSAGIVPILNQKGRDNVFEINGTLRPTAGGTAILVESGTLENNRFVLGATAVIEGDIVIVGSSATLEIDIAGSQALTVRSNSSRSADGAWLDANGNGWLSDFSGQASGKVYVVGGASEATNNDHDLGGNDHLLLAAGATITTTAAAAHGIHNAGGNRYTARGDIATAGAGAHAIYHERGDSLYTIAGGLEATGTDAYAIYNRAGNGRYLIEEGATLSGTFKTEDGVTATLILSDAITLVDFMAVTLEGSWVDGEGNAFTLPGFVSSAATATNGGHMLAAGDALLVTAAGSIDTGSADGESAIAVTAAAVEVTANGPLSAGGANAHGIHVNSAGGSASEAATVQVNAAVTVTGAGAHGIYHESGTANYAIAAAVSATGQDGYAIYHESGTAAFRLLAGATVTGTVKTDIGAMLTFGPGVTEWNLNLEGDWRDSDGLRVNPTSAAAQTHTVDFPDATTNGGFRVDGQDTLVIESGMDGGGMAFGIVTAAAETPAVLLPADASGNTVTVRGRLETQGAGSPVITARGAGSTVTVAAAGVVRAAADQGQAGRAGSHGIEVSGNGAMVSLAAGSAVTVDGPGAHGIYNTTRTGDDGGAEGDGGTTANPNAYRIAGSVATSGSAARGIYHEAGVASYHIAAAVSTSGTGAHAVYHQAGTATYTFAADANIAVDSGTDSHPIYHEAGVATYIFETGARVSGTLRAEAPATLAAPHGFDFSDVAVEGDWNHAPTATGTALAAPAPGPAEGVAWSWSPANLAAVFGDRDEDDVLAYAFDEDELPEWLTAAASGAAPRVTGTPPADSTGDMFTLAVTATDGAVGTVPARAEITVTIGTSTPTPTPTPMPMPMPPTGQPMVANPIAPLAAVTGRRNFAVGLAGVFVDPDGDALNLEATSADGMTLPSWLVLNRDSAAAPRLFAATVGAAGVYTIRVTADDGSGGGGSGAGGEGSGNGGDGGEGGRVSTDFTLTVTAPATEPATPVAADDLFPFTRGQRLAGNVLGNDSDANLDAMMVAWFWIAGDAANRVAAGGALTLPGLGELTLAADGNFLLALAGAARTLGTGESRTVTVAYLAGDGTGLDGMAADTTDETAPAVGRLTLTVRGSDAEPNAAPRLILPVPALTAYAGLPFRYAVPANVFRDGNLERLSYTASLADGGSLPGWLAFDITAGVFAGTPTAEDIATAPLALVLRATDAVGESATAAFRLTVVAAPMIGAMTVADGTATLHLPHVELSPGIPGNASPCLALTLTAPVTDMSAWEFEMAPPALGCGAPAGTANLPLLDGTLALDVPRVRFTPEGGAMTCLAMQFRHVGMFRLTAIAATTCPAP